MKISKKNLSLPTSGYVVFLKSLNKYQVAEITPELLEAKDIEETHFLNSSDYLVDLSTLKLTVKEELRDDVVWFRVIEGRANKYEVKKKVAGVADLLLSVLTIGLYGWFKLKALSNRNNEIIVRLQQMQERCCAFSLIENVIEIPCLFKDQKEVLIAKDLRDSYESFFNVRNVIDSKKDVDPSEGVEVFVDEKNPQEELNQYKNVLSSSDEIKAVVYLKNEYGTFRRIASEIEKLRSEREVFVTQRTKLNLDEEFEIALELTRTYGSFSNIRSKFAELERDSHKLRTVYGKLGQEELNEWFELKDDFRKASIVRAELNELNNYKAFVSISAAKELNQLLQKYGSISYVQNRISKLEAEAADLNRKLLVIGSEEDVNTAVFLRQQYGSFSTIADKLQGIAELDHLRLENKELKEKDKSWEELAGNKTLEQALQIRRDKENESKTSKGRDLEVEIANILSELSNNGVNDIDWQSQYLIPNTREKADFLISFRGNKGNSFHVIVESKRRDQLDSLEELSIEQHSEDDFKKGINQLCGYYNKADKNIHLGLLVTNSHTLEKIGFRKVSPKELESKYADQEMNLLLVHFSSFKKMITIIRILSHIYEPEIECALEQKGEFYRDPDMQKNLRHMTSFFRDCNKKLITAMNSARECSKKANSVEKHVKSYLQHFEEIQNTFEKVCNQADFYLDKPLLEGSLQPEEEILVGEDEQE